MARTQKSTFKKFYEELKEIECEYNGYDDLTARPTKERKYTLRTTGTNVVEEKKLSEGTIKKVAWEDRYKGI